MSIASTLLHWAQKSNTFLFWFCVESGNALFVQLRAVIIDQCYGNVRGQFGLLDTFLCPMMTDGRTCVHKKSRLWLVGWGSRSNTSSHTISTGTAVSHMLWCAMPHLKYVWKPNKIVISCSWSKMQLWKVLFFFRSFVQTCQWKVNENFLLHFLCVFS